MFLSLLLVMLTLQPVQDDVSSWMKLIESGQLEQVEAEIRQHPEQATPIIEELLSQFDSSVHSWRDRPEQRRIRYSDDLLQSGLKLTRLVTELTGDNTFERRFEARRDRVRATQMLNDGEFDEAMALIESVRGTARELEDQSFLFSTYLSSAYAFLGTGQPDKALVDCELALSLAREMGERVNLTQERELLLNVPYRSMPYSCFLKSVKCDAREHKQNEYKCARGDALASSKADGPRTDIELKSPFRPLNTFIAVHTTISFKVTSQAIFTLFTNLGIRNSHLSGSKPSQHVEVDTENLTIP